MNSNEQDFRHTCVREGGQSKCHICEDFQCDTTDVSRTCAVQLQGINYSEMSVNVPVLTDTSWAVGGSYRKGTYVRVYTRILVS